MRITLMVPKSGSRNEYLDPEIELPGIGGVYNSVNLGLYSYFQLNPIIFIDPDGRYSLWPFNKKIEKVIKARAKNYGVDVDPSIADEFAHEVRMERQMNK